MKRNRTSQGFHWDLSDLVRRFPIQNIFLKISQNDVDVIWGDLMWSTDRALDYIKSYSDKIICILFLFPSSSIC